MDKAELLRTDNDDADDVVDCSFNVDDDVNVFFNVFVGIIFNVNVINIVVDGSVKGFGASEQKRQNHDDNDDFFGDKK